MIHGERARTVGLLRGMLLVGASAAALNAGAGAASAQTNVSSGDTGAVQTAPTQDNGASVNSGSALSAGAPKGAGTSPVAATVNGNEVSPTSSVSEVVVTGLRGSLQRDLNIKKNSTGIVDAISAEDIGKFPDSNLAAAIQRIPGVSISRGTSSIGGVPTSNGDATEITVRGFGPTFNETLYDDRQVSAGTTNGGFDFSAVGADFVGEVDILKTPDASLSSGAIGATINIKYPKPFDHPGARIAGSISTTYSPEDGHATPNGGLLVSDTFLNDTVGILADFAYSDHKVRGNHINNQGWIGGQIAPSQLAGAPAGASTTPSLTEWTAQDFGVYQEFTNTSREDGRVVLQWKPMANFLLTLNDNYSRERVTADQNGYSVWFNSGQLTNVVQGADGTVRNFNQPNTPTDFQAQVNKEVLQNNEYGLNAKYDFNSNFTVDLDLDRAESWLNPNGQITSIDSDVGYGNGTTGQQTNSTGEVIGNGLPYLNQNGPGGNSALFINNGIIGSHVFPISSQQNDDIVNQGKLQGVWNDEALQIRFGTQYVSDHFHQREFDTFANSDWQAYSGYGPESGSATGIALPQNFFTGSFDTSGFIPGNTTNLPAKILKFNPYQVLNYLQGLGNPQTMNIPGYNRSAAPTYNGTYRLVEAPASHKDISEDTWSGFLTASEKTHLAGMPLTINLGVREEITRTTVDGLGQQLLSLTQVVGDHTALNPALSATTPIKAGNIQSNFLPNLDLNLQVTDKLKIRLDASRTLTRPPLADLSPVLTVNNTQRINSLQASGGNPGLLPYTSDNGDLGAEWYYARNSYISLDGFVKHVSNFVVGGTTRQTINNVVDPTTGQLAQFSVTTQVNGPDATIHGLEAGIQHTFWDTGFGFQLNATFVGSDKAYDRENLTQSGFAVTGLADSANFVAFYDKNGFQARVAVNWRDSYLDHFGQQQNNSAFGTEPTFVDSNTTVDFSTSYDITKNISVYFEALNLSDSGYFTHGRFSEQLLDAVSYGRRFTLGAHLRY